MVEWAVAAYRDHQCEEHTLASGGLDTFLAVSGSELLDHRGEEEIMKYHIHKAVVIGSGTMGAAIAAHLANAGVPVTFLDIVPKDAPAEDQAARNKIVNEGWDRCLKARPANLDVFRVEDIGKAWQSRR